MAIVQAIIIMAHTLHLKAFTEGVETPAQLAFLNHVGSDYVQGYLFSRPQPLERILPLAKQMNAREANSRWPVLPFPVSKEPDVDVPEPIDPFDELPDSDSFVSHRPVRT
ncbi:EAL domain-containing protein [Pseudomonas syringae pv. coryli]|uniref:EAL domain-containing protein n=1 Tax=Pseudomonas syringae pv. coryli TaxID=317659 RepID=A0A0P9P0C3_9PSED|nr:EAL domain-containing protein [Pseudomonas syringae pv. coryli]KPX05545.1 hypothetical protein ALO75_200240 [Pseudomonas syringae pv. coryli]